MGVGRGMLRTILLISIIINTFFIFVVYNDNEQGEGIFVLVNDLEKECLVNWKSKDQNVTYIKEHKIIGPEIFVGSSVLEFGGYPVNLSFQYEFSSCFNKDYAWVDSLDELDAAIQIFEAKTKNVGFYKSTDSSRIIVYSSD